MSPVHQVRPKPSCRAQWKGEEDKGRSRKTTSGNGQAWSSPRPRRQWRTGENGGRLLQNHLWCPSRLRYKWDDMRNWHIFAFFFLCKQFTNCSQTFHEVKKKTAELVEHFCSPKRLERAKWLPDWLVTLPHFYTCDWPATSADYSFIRRVGLILSENLRHLIDVYDRPIGST